MIYDISDYALLPHDPMDATAEELVQDEMAWRTGAIGTKYELASTKNHEKGRLKYAD